MTDIKPGTRVRVEYEGVVYKTCLGSTGEIGVADDSRKLHFYNPSTVNITPLKPANWPPRIGDTWKADDGLYCIRRRPYTGHPVADGIDHYGYFTDMEDFKDLNPVLLFRPEQD